MTLAFALSIAAIAFVDSLNPSLFIAQFYLLTTPKPIPRLLSYIMGILVVNFAGGIVILAGARAVVSRFVESVPPEALRIGQIGLGVAALLFAVWILRQAYSTDGDRAVRKPRSLSVVHTFLLGMVVMLNEITTALPYFAAIEQIVQAELSTPQTLIVLAGYNAVFALPLFGFVGLYVALRQRFTTQLGAITAWIERWTPRLLGAFSVAIGVWLLIDGAAYFIGQWAA